MSEILFEHTDIGHPARPRVDIRSEINPMRSPHRSTLFRMQFDISAVLDPDGRALIYGEELEEYLFVLCREAIRGALANGRAKVPGHP